MGRLIDQIEIRITDRRRTKNDNGQVLKVVRPWMAKNNLTLVATGDYLTCKIELAREPRQLSIHRSIWISNLIFMY